MSSTDLKKFRGWMYRPEIIRKKEKIMETKEKQEKGFNEADHEKTDKLMNECIDNGLVPMEHTITIKFVQKTDLKITKMTETSKEEVNKAIAPLGEKIGESLEKWIDENLRPTEVGLTEFTYSTCPYGIGSKVKLLASLLDSLK